MATPVTSTAAHTETGTDRRCAVYTPKMSARALRSRWQDAAEAHAQLIHKLSHGGALTQSDSPFGSTPDGRIDLRGLDASRSTWSDASVHAADLEHMEMQPGGFVNCDFVSCSFKSARLIDIGELGNHFCECSFDRARIHRSSLGHRASQFERCQFSRTSLRGSSFINATFTDCIFVGCQFNGVDFGSSSFVRCSFHGRVEGAWFRGGYASQSLREEFNAHSDAIFEDVSFAEAELVGVTFSNHCDLSRVTPPEGDGHRVFSDWQRVLTAARDQVAQLPASQGKALSEFIDIHSAYHDQDWMILNIAEVRSWYGEDSSIAILKALDRASRSAR